MEDQEKGTTVTDEELEKHYPKLSTVRPRQGWVGGHMALDVISARVPMEGVPICLYARGMAKPQFLSNELARDLAAALLHAAELASKQPTDTSKLTPGNWIENFDGSTVFRSDEAEGA